MYRQILAVMLTGLLGIMACSSPDPEPDNRIAPGSQAQGEVLPHERPSLDMTDSASSEPKTTEQVLAEARRVADMLSPKTTEQVLAEAQRVADENARRRREVRGLAAPLPADRHTDDPTRWEIPEPWLAAACSPWEIGVRVCLGVTAEHVLLESSLPQIIGDEWTVRIGGNEWTGNVSTQGNVVWTGSDHTGMTVLMMVAGAEGHVDDDVLRWSDQAIVTDADGMEFRVSLRGAGEAIRQAVYR